MTDDIDTRLKYITLSTSFERGRLHIKFCELAAINQIRSNQIKNKKLNKSYFTNKMMTTTIIATPNMIRHRYKFFLLELFSYL